MGKPRPNNRTAAVELRDVEMLNLEAQGWARTRIAEHLGVHKSTVTRGIERTLAEVKVEAAGALRQRSRERLRLVIEAAFDDLAKTGATLTERAALYREIRRCDESLRRMDGLDAPTRKVVEVITEDVIDAELRALSAEHAELTRGDAPD